MGVPRTSIDRACEHAPEAIATPGGNVCEECGSTFNLRLCATCGYVGCCESQAGDARAHALGENHPVILQIPIGKGFARCNAENAYV